MSVYKLSCNEVKGYIGCCDLNIIMNAEKYKINFVILETEIGAEPILGITTISNLNLIKTNINKLTKSIIPCNLQMLLNEYDN